MGEGVLLVFLPGPTEGGEGNMEARCNTRAWQERRGEGNREDVGGVSPPFCLDSWRGEREHNHGGRCIGASYFFLFEILFKFNFSKNSNKLTSGNHVVVENNWN